MLTATLVQELEDFAEVVTKLWPLYIMIVAVVAGSKKFTKSLVAELTEVIEEKLKPIKVEVTPNGGGSMKDAVKRLEQGQAHLSDKLRDVSHTLQKAGAIATLNQGRLQAVTANLPVAYYEMNAEGNITSVNDAYLKLYNITEQEALNSSAWRKHISQADLLIIDASGQQSLTAQKDWYCSFDVYRDGLTIPVVARAKALFTNGEFSGFSGAITFDISLINKGL